MSAYHRTTEAIRRARQARRLVVLPVQCWRCGRVIAEGMAFQMGHTVDVALGGTDSQLLPEHTTCNQRAGARLGGKRKAIAERTRKARPTKPSW